MASSTLTGDRRWASTRKSGMIILGKVPKPLNLPSQKLENNGLDPNVEIVPKGIFTWGSRPASAAPSAWNSATLLSPKTEGSTGSPSHHNGCPSSSGSGTRPSTAGSDRSHDPSSNAWGSNSRPSTASGLFPSNQTPIIATRPRSAETRPGSSQLSRFAENWTELTVAKGPMRTAERLGAASSKIEEFALSSGDFPTLGAEKISERHIERGHSSQQLPSSASVTDATVKGNPSSTAGFADGFLDHGNVTTLKADKNSYSGGSSKASTKWQNEPQQAQPYASLNLRPHQFDSLQGHSVYPPGGIWHRGGTTGGSYRPAAPPGSYPDDSYGYYLHQSSPNSEIVLRPGAGPAGHHPTNAQACHPEVPANSYIVASHPVILTRPRAYQTPGTFDGYCAPHQAFFNSGQQKGPFMKMVTLSGIYDQYQNQNDNLNSGQFQTRPGGQDSKMGSEQMISDSAHAHQGPYRILLKQHDNNKDNHVQENVGHVVSTLPDIDGVSIPGKDKQCRSLRKNEQMEFVKLEPVHQGLSQSASACVDHSSNSIAAASQENSNKVSDGILRKPETAISVAVVHGRQHHSMVGKNTMLIKKIEGLNNKAQSADNHKEVAQLKIRQERSMQPNIMNAKSDNSLHLIFSNTVSAITSPTSGIIVPTVEVNDTQKGNNLELSGDKKFVPGPSESQVILAAKSEPLKTGGIPPSYARTRVHTTHYRDEHHAKSRSGSCDEGCKNEPSGRDSAKVMEAIAQGGFVVGILECNSSNETAVKEFHVGTTSVPLNSSPDSLDYKAQRAKLKEMATLRAKQLQKEEEDRTREQKAKALAKLEELNRRSGAPNLKQDNDALPPKEYVHQQEDFGADPPSDGPGHTLEGSDALVLASNSESKNLGAPVHFPSNTVSSASSSNLVPRNSAVAHETSLSKGQDTKTIEGATPENSSLTHDANGSKHKQMGHRRRQKISQEKIPGEKLIMAENMESSSNLSNNLHECPGEKPIISKDLSGVRIPALDTDGLPHDEEPSAQHKRKSNRSSRSKNKLYEAPVSYTLPSSAHTGENLEENTTRSHSSQSLASAAKTMSTPAQGSPQNSQSQDFGDGASTSSKQRWSKANEEAHNGMSNQCKTQPTRRSARDQQGIRPIERFHGAGAETAIWAPVKPTNRNEKFEKSNQKNETENNCQSLQRNEQDIKNASNTKRAEIERYVPKPVAKRLSQQENSQESSSVNQSTMGDITGESHFNSKNTGIGRLDGMLTEKVEFAAVTKTGEDDKSGRHGRKHASWRQKNLSESTSPLEIPNKSYLSSAVSKLFDKPPDQHQPSDSWESNNDSVSTAVVKDQGVTSRQRRHQFEYLRVTGSDCAPSDHNHLQTGVDDASDSRSLALPSNELDARNALRTDNNISGIEHTRTHWKPKSHPSHIRQPVNSVNRGQRDGSCGGRSDKEFLSQGFEDNLFLNESNSAMSQKDGIKRITNVGHHEVGDKKISKSAHSSNMQAFTTNENMAITARLDPSDVNTQHEHQAPPARRRYGQHNGSFNRGQDTTYRGKDLGQASTNQDFHINGDKRKNSPHFEYHPVDSSKKSSDLFHSNSNISKQTHEDHKAPSRGYREWGRYQTRRGGHSRWSSGNDYYNTVNES